MTNARADIVRYRLERSQSMAQIYNDLFARRQESDYLDFVRFEAAQVQPWIAEAELFVAHIATIIERREP